MYHCVMICYVAHNVNVDMTMLKRSACITHVTLCVLICFLSFLCCKSTVLEIYHRYANIYIYYRNKFIWIMRNFNWFVFLSSYMAQLFEIFPRLLCKLTHWGRVTHICVDNLTNIVSDNGWSPSRCQAIIWTNAGILLIWPIGTYFNEILIEIHGISFTNINLKISPGKCRPFCLGLNVLIPWLLITWQRLQPYCWPLYSHPGIFRCLYQKS